MADVSEHCEDCIKILGNPYDEVHKFLDQYAREFEISIFFEYHRTFLHNRYGIENVMAMWGEEAVKAAIIHIVRDWHGIPLGEASWEWVKSKLGKALMDFNNMDYFDPRLDPRIVGSWKESLCAMVFSTGSPRQEKG